MTRVDLTLGVPRCITAPRTSMDEWKNRSRHLMRTLTVDWRTVDGETIDRNAVGDTCQRCCCSLLTPHHLQRGLQSRLFLIQNLKKLTLNKFYLIKICNAVLKSLHPSLSLTLCVSLPLIDTAKPFYSELWISPRLLCVCMSVHVSHIHSFLGQILRLSE